MGMPSVRVSDINYHDINGSVCVPDYGYHPLHALKTWCEAGDMDTRIV